MMRVQIVNEEMIDLRNRAAQGLPLPQRQMGQGLALCKVRSVQFRKKGIPYLNTYDGKTIRYPDPFIKGNDMIKLDLESNKIVDFIKFDVGNVVMVTDGRNRRRVGVIKNREKHKGSFETIHIQDALGHEFATRVDNVFTIGKGFGSMHF
ncbi:40S ribosomal protein S4-like [Olea europaea var. sylvestris]|uniref:40S ribosomal protein S4-like n=1 Tax=Olea europaea var. sylvestris TaxID=158386 RepID=UPI000C1D10DC|nr:40S ribosomal protein S4-like [Olea europaea var. sylvestris]